MKKCMHKNKNMPLQPSSIFSGPWQMNQSAFFSSKILCANRQCLRHCVILYARTGFPSCVWLSHPFCCTIDFVDIKAVRVPSWWRSRLFNVRDLKIRGRLRQRKRRWKSEFTFFQSSTRLLQVTNFVKCRRTLLRLNSYEPHPSSERERKFRRRLCTSSVHREIWHFHVVVVQWRQRNVQKSVMHVQNCCFAN